MSRKILVADDNEINRRILMKILSDEYQVIEAENGDEALGILKSYSEEISAVLLDIVMPDVNGYDVLRRMRADERMRRIPVIVTTGSTDAGSEVKALSLGANDYVTKPYNQDIIRHRLRNTIKLRETAAFVNMAQRDDLTSLYSRRRFFELAAEMIKSKPAGYYVMACFDINKFKVINDQYGTQKGDEVLCFVAETFVEGFEPVGGICCRIMADHFAVLYPKSFVGTEALAEIRRKASTYDSSLFPLTFGVGRYIVDDLSLSVSAMYDRASIAADSVKGNFNDHIGVYDENMLKSILEEQTIISEMNSALENNNFEVWIQPQYNHSTGALCGGEALVRWRHPKKGLISPGIFIPVFERNGFIYELDKYVWEQVCITLRRWIDENRSPLPVSVNISRCDVLHDDITDVILGLVRKYYIPFDLLRLEITESAFEKSSERIIAVVKQLIGYGFTVEIDDFGSGYSSLNTLKDVPANILKLDMRFLEGDENKQRGGSILESIVRMAKWLGMPVIAEGVETKEQADYLSTIGCNCIQGFYYAKPMPISEYELLYAKGAKRSKMLSAEQVDIFGSTDIWNPESLDSLIFNVYVGGAFIFEYSGGKVDLLRVNDKFIKMLGCKGMTIEDFFNIKWKDHLDDAEIEKIMNAIRRIADTENETAFDAACMNFRENNKVTHIHVLMHILARSAERRLILCSCENITEIREIENRLRETEAKLRFLNVTAGEMLSGGAPDGCIVSVLRKALAYFGGSRAFIYEYFHEELSCVNTYEACSAGITPYKDIYKKIPLKTARHWIKNFEKSDCLYIEDVDSISRRHREDIEVCKAYGAKSLLAVSIRISGRIAGTIGIINPTLRTDEFDSLETLSDYMAAIISRRDFDDKIKNKNKEMANLMDDMPGGFARIKVYPNGRLAMTYANDKFCSLLDAGSEEILRICGTDAMNGLHPDDAELVAAAVNDMYANDGRINVKCRLKHAKRGYVDVFLLGRLACDEVGDKYLNIFYTDLSEREKHKMSLQDMLPVALSAVMESSTEISFVKDKNFAYICCSDAFRALTSADEKEQIIGQDDYTLFSKEIADKYHEFDKRILETGQPIINNVECIQTKDGAVHYINTSKYPLCDNYGNIIGIYGIGQDMTGNHESYAQLKLLADNIPGGLAILECAADSIKMLYFNEGFYNLTGYTRREYAFFANENPLFLVFADDLHILREQFEKMLNGGAQMDATYRIHTKAGDCRWQNLKGALSSRQGDRVIVNVVRFDVTAQKEIDEKLRLGEEQYRLAVALSGSIICRFDVASRTIIYSPDVAAMFAMEECVGNVPYEPVRMGSISAESVDAYIDFFEHIIHGENAGVATFRCMMASGWRWLRASYSTIFSKTDEPISAIIAFVDITEEHRREEESKRAKENERVLKIQAETDGMTGLYNKATAEALIAQRISLCTDECCALLFVDLDNLKTINDTYGHPQGDKTIRLMADVLISQFRRNDIVGRIGGDEFVVFLGNYGTEESLIKLVNILLERLSQLKTGENDDIPITASIGVSVGTPMTESFSVLYERADRALYHAKRSGKKQVAFYSADM